MPARFLGAVDIGGTKIQVGLLTDDGRVLGERSFPTESDRRSGEEAVSEIAGTLGELCGFAGISMADLSGVGVFCAGPVDTVRGTVENPYTLPGWEGLQLKRLLSEKTGLPVVLENDANGALLGEIFARKLSGKRVLMVTLGTGIGVAFLDGAKLYRTGRYHPEMGHIIVTGDGPDCYCGHRGCFESLCSGKAINQRCHDAGFRDFAELINAGGPLLHRIRQEFQNGIWTLRAVFQPEVVILAGGFGKAYFPWLSEALTGERENQPDFTGEGCVLPQSDVTNAALLGAALLEI